MLRKDERVEELFDRLIIILRHLKKRPNRKLVLTVRDKFPFVLDAKVSAFLTDKKWAEHFPTLCTVPYADTCQRPCTKPVYIEIYYGRLVFLTDNVYIYRNLLTDIPFGICHRCCETKNGENNDEQYNCCDSIWWIHN